MVMQATEKPVRIGVFDTVAEAERAIQDLRAAGFTHDQLSVICSDRHKAALFHGVQTPAPAGDHTPEAVLEGAAVGAAAGGAIGAVVGGMALAASAMLTGGASLLVAGGAFLAGGAFVGSFTGAMMTRGLEPEMVNYFDQAVQHGKILVAVEVVGDGNQARLASAERILRRDGTDPVRLPEG